MKIGKLNKVDIRELWKGEATDFTPWLANEDNIEQLSEIIGIELEVISEEKSVGPFRADILCKSTLDDTYVLIENQLEKTDHNHLGQLMTYAAGLEAVTVIWIAKKFTDEHRAALDWLNRITEEEIRFFGIEVEAYQIEDSKPAPMFQLVSKPNDWTKAIHSTRNQNDLTETQTINLEFWSALKNYLESSNSSLRSQKPAAQNWTNYAVGKSDYHISAVHSVRNNFIRVEFWITGNESKKRFDILRSKYEIDSYEKISQQLTWDRLEGKKASCAFLKKNNTDVTDRNDWPNQFQWIMENVKLMDDFFRPKLKSI